MPEYRFYRIDRRGHRLGPPEVADWANDEEAVAHAKRIRSTENNESAFR